MLLKNKTKSVQFPVKTALILSDPIADPCRTSKDYFSPHLARWNAASMTSSCRDLFIGGQLLQNHRQADVQKHEKKHQFWCQAMVMIIDDNWFSNCSCYIFMHVFFHLRHKIYVFQWHDGILHFLQPKQPSPNGHGIFGWPPSMARAKPCRRYVSLARRWRPRCDTMPPSAAAPPLQCIARSWVLRHFFNEIVDLPIKNGGFP